MRLTDELFGIVLENQRREMLRFVAGYEVAKSADASALYLHVLYQTHSLTPVRPHYAHWKTR